MRTLSVIPPASWPLLLSLGLASRVPVLVLGCVAARAVLPEPYTREPRVAAANKGYNQRHLSALSGPSHRWVEPWYRFDALWYAEVSRRGYAYEPNLQCTAPFFPLLPLLMSAAASLGVDRYWAGLVTANAAFAVGLAVFGRVARRVTGDDLTAWKASLLLVAFPASMFFSAPYPESLALALTAAAVLCRLDGCVLGSATALALASAAKVTAVAMSVGLVAEWVWDAVRGRAPRSSAWLVALSGGVGSGAFFLFMSLKFGDPLVSLKAQAAWDRSPAGWGNVLSLMKLLAFLLRTSAEFALLVGILVVWLLQGLPHTVLSWAGAAGRSPAPRPAAGGGRRSPPRAGLRAWCPPDVALGASAGALFATGLLLTRFGMKGLSDRALLTLLTLDGSANFLTLILFAGLGLRAWVRKGPLWGCLTLVPIAQAVATGSVMSMMRISLAAFPAFIEAAELLRGRAAFILCFFSCLICQHIFVIRFVNWRFVG